MLFGGGIGGFFGTGMGDTWEWDGLGWTLRSSTGPEPRVRHSMIYDESRGTVQVYGGNDAGVSFDELWEWDGSIWLSPFPAGPLLVESYMVRDTERGVTVVHGTPTSGSLWETWEWDGSTWSMKSQLGPRLFDTAMIFDPTRRTTVLLGGWDSTGANGTKGEAWEWNGNDWALLIGKRRGPFPRANHAMTWDSRRRVAVVFGGETDFTNFVYGDVWESSPRLGLAAGRR